MKKKENFNNLSEQHLLGKTRLGATPEILGQEDKVMFGCIDIDCPDISHKEKYNIALSLQDKLLEDYGLRALIETSKSKGFHVWIPFLIPQERSFIKHILQIVINSVTDRKISNGEIEVFPKGIKVMLYSCHSLECLKMKISLMKAILYKRKILLLKVII